MMFIRTSRLMLRPVFAEDWRPIHRAMDDQALVSMLSLAPWPYQEDDAQAFCAGAHQRAPFAFAITVPEMAGAPVIGHIDLIRRDATDKVYDMGYWIVRGQQGRGYATEAAQAVVCTARALGIRRIEAGFFLDNLASGAVLRKCGLAETGEIRLTKCNGRGGGTVLTRRMAIDLQVGGAAMQAVQQEQAA